MVVQLNTPVAVCSQFSAYIVEFNLKTDTFAEKPNAVSPNYNVTTVLMSQATDRRVPKKINENNNKEKLHNRVIEYLKENGINWHPTVVTSTGQAFVTSLTKLLWHITNHHNTFSDRAAHLPAFVTTIFADWNEWRTNNQSKPDLSKKVPT